MSHTTTPISLLNTHTNLITIISEHHGWRTLGGIQTSDYYTYRNAIQDGCHLQRASFDLRHPEEMICDLSNLDPIYNSMCSNEIINLWNYLDLGTKKIKIDGVRRIEGDGLSPEIAISGPSRSILENLKSSLINEAFSHNQYSAISATKSKSSRGIAKSRLLINSNSETVNFHNKFCAFYSKYIVHENWDDCSALNTRFIYEEHEIWQQIKKLAKNKLFILSAGLPLALGYMAATGDQSIYFTEIHRQNDANLFNKNNTFHDIFPIPTSPTEPWLVVDKSYTGGSLRQAANTIRKKYGYGIDIKTVALFPKSFSALMSADYAVYAGKLLDVRAIAPRLDRDLWHLQLLVE